MQVCRIRTFEDRICVGNPPFARFAKPHSFFLLRTQEERP